MGDARPNPPARVRLLTAGAALVLAGAAAALWLDLAGDERVPPAAATPTPAPAPATPSEAEPEPPARARSRTVYGALDHLDECARGPRSMGAASSAPGLGDDIRAIARRVERLRRLEFESRVNPRLLPRGQVAARFLRGFRRELSTDEAARQARVLAVLGLIPDGLDLRAAAERLFGDAVAGFYEPRGGRLYAAATGGVLSPFDEVVLAHELDHALVDQGLGLPRTTGADPRRGDALLAHQALAEGDATLAMSRYAYARLGATATAGFLTRFSGSPVAPREDVPYVLLRTSEFPYFEGLLLACTVWRRGGWDAIDALYERPPATTAGILFPSRLHATPEDAPRPDDPGRGWKRLLTGSLGAFDVMLLLENADVVATGSARPGSHVDVVRGWAGGALTAWRRGPRTTVHLAVTDAGVATASRTDRRLCSALRGWVGRTFPEAAPLHRGRDGVQTWKLAEGAAALTCDGAAVELAVGAGIGVVRRVVGIGAGSR